VGVTAAGAAAITADELIDLFHSLDIAYRANAVFQANDLTLAAIRKLKDSDGQYLWQTGLTAGQPDMLLGKPVLANNDVAVLATTAKTVWFGDPSKYIIRQVRGMRFRRLDELYAANDQVGFVAFNRWDGDAIQANAMKVLQQA
jgi:HK97 family phage major capsid protein